MSGKRLLDAAILANAARAVAKQHLKLRSQQLDTWNKTSTVAKAVKNQTDRLTLTVQAASALAQRFNDSNQQNQYYSRSQDETVPRHDSVNGQSSDGTGREEGLQQDHHYKRSDHNTTSEPPKDADLDIEQRKASRFPTRDGSIPPSGAPVDSAAPIDLDADISTERPQETPVKDPAGPVEEAQLEPETSQRSSIPEPTVEPTTEIPREEVVPEQDQVPDGINTDVFHSPRVAQLLGGKPRPKRAEGDIGLPRAKDSPVDKTQTSEGKDQDTFNVRTSASSYVNTTGQGNEAASTQSATQSHDDIHSLATDIAKDAETASEEGASGNVQDPSSTHGESAPYNLRESRVPSSRFGRLAQYGGLATSMAFGAIGETFRRATGFGSSGGSLMLSASNMERLVAKLSRMRGAALKLGQMMSFQDSKMLPAPIHEVLLRVQDNADYMPPSQRDGVLSSNLGSDWRSLFSSFSEVPFAAASIGQVHQATLASSDTPVAVKIQYPGVATSISSDLSNLSILLTASRLLPKGLFLDKTIANARSELAWECDYEREAKCQERFRHLLADEPDVFSVPAVVQEASGPQVLTAQMMQGTAVTKASLNLTQPERDWIGTQILRLCLRELTDFKFMQTDPNWTNFLYNRAARKLELLDFGAARDFPARFIDPYIRLLVAASKGDRATVRDLSLHLGYLTGHESSRMVDAHVASVLTLAEPFSENVGAPDAVYDFRDQTITDRVRKEIPVMLRERLAPPPEETYSLHRRLSGSFLLLARLGSRVKCREMFVNAIDTWKARLAAAGDGGSGGV